MHQKNAEFSFRGTKTKNQTTTSPDESAPGPTCTVKPGPNQCKPVLSFRETLPRHIRIKGFLFSLGVSAHTTKIQDPAGRETQDSNHSNTKTAPNNNHLGRMKPNYFTPQASVLQLSTDSWSCDRL